jgi:hypothetical protein
MRLTVGPLPAAVYWRRRALVLGVLGLFIVGIVYMFTGGPSAGTGAPPGSTGTPAASPTGEVSATPGPSTSPTPITSQFTPPAGLTGPCTDSEIELTARPSPADPLVGEMSKFELIVRSVSTRTCVRNVGSIPQELRLMQDDRIVWSSDDCRPEGFQDYNRDEQLAPGTEMPFFIWWEGYRTRDGIGEHTCERSATTTVGPGAYVLVARLGTKLSEPSPVAVRNHSPATGA